MVVVSIEAVSSEPVRVEERVGHPPPVRLVDVIVCVVVGRAVVEVDVFLGKSVAVEFFLKRLITFGWILGGVSRAVLVVVVVLVVVGDSLDGIFWHFHCLWLRALCRACGEVGKNQVVDR